MKQKLHQDKYKYFIYFISIIYSIQLDLTLFFLKQKMSCILRYIILTLHKGYVFAEEIPLTIVVKKRVNQFVYINQINNFILGPTVYCQAQSRFTFLDIGRIKSSLQCDPLAWSRII